MEASESALEYATSRQSRIRRQDGRRNTFRHETTQAESSRLPDFKLALAPTLHPSATPSFADPFDALNPVGSVGGETEAKMRMRV